MNAVLARSISTLAYLPCGCAADFREELIEHDCVICPWCEAVIDIRTFFAWHAISPSPVVTVYPPVARDDERVVEVIGHTSCGHLVVRERVRGAELEHCDRRLHPLKN